MKFYFESCYLESAEYGKIVSEINTNYQKYRGRTLAVHMSYDWNGTPYWYYFENHGFNKYNFYDKKNVTEEGYKNE